MSQIKQKQKHWSALVFTAVNFLPGNVCLISTVKGKALIRTLTMREKLGNVVNIVTLNMTTTQVMMSITTMQTASAMSSSEKELSNRLHIK